MSSHTLGLCALEIQQELEAKNAALPAMRQIRFRIGAHLGDVISADGRIYGDGVNVAARLEPLAAPGGLCLSGAIAEQVRGKLAISYQDLGEQALKNIASPVRAYRVVPEGAAGLASSRASAPVLRPHRPLHLALAGAALAALAAGAWPLGAFRVPAGAVSPTIEASLVVPASSVAVLPFESLSTNKEDDYLAPGLAAAVQHRPTYPDTYDPLGRVITLSVSKEF